MPALAKRLHTPRGGDGEDFENSSPTRLDKEEIFAKIYHRIRSLVRDAFLEPEHINTAVKKAITFGSE